MRRKPLVKTPPVEIVGVWAQSLPVDGKDDWRYTGHAFVIRCDTLRQGAEKLVIKLRAEGKPAMIGHLHSTVLEDGNREGGHWFYIASPDATLMFAGLREMGEGAYYREPTRKD